MRERARERVHNIHLLVGIEVYVADVGQYNGMICADNRVCRVHRGERGDRGDRGNRVYMGCRGNRVKGQGKGLQRL